MAEKCPCQTDVHACCACVSTHCDECFKPKQSKFVQGRFCSNCGRPLKTELTRLYVPKSEVEWLEKENARLLNLSEYNRSAIEQDITDAKAEVAREIFAEIDKNFILIPIYDIEFKELKRKYTE